MKRVCIAVAVLSFGGIAASSFAGGGQQNTPDFDSPRQRLPEDPAAKQALVARILEVAEPRSGKPWDEAARANISSLLLARSLQALSDAVAEGGDAALDILMGEALGSTLNDWVFTPLPACRVLDTRAGSGFQGAGTGPYAAGTVHSFDVGSICGIPFPAARAAVLNFVAAFASGNGNLRAWPWDSTNPPAPGTVVLNFTAGFNTSNAIVQPICNTTTATGANCSDDLFVEPFVSATEVIIDTVGYFAAPVATALDCTTETAAVALPAGVGQTATASATCLAGYVATGGGAFAGPQITMNKISIGGTSVFCRLTNETAGAITADCQARCCRVPGR